MPRWAYDNRTDEVFADGLADGIAHGGILFAVVICRCGLDKRGRTGYNGEKGGIGMHEIEVKGILSARGGMNLYRGCTHGCVYCDSRSACYQMDHDFEDVAVKVHGLELLEAELRRRRRPGMVSFGAMTDPYIPLERDLRYTRGALELLDRYGFGAAVQTKSDLLLRDLELLGRINRRSKAVVQMTLTTYDEELCRLLEPRVCTTARRVQVLQACREAGIPTVVWLSPILPFLNDTPENLRGLLEYCVRAGVRRIICFGMGLTLREGNREYFYRQLDRHFPGLSGRYRRVYGSAYEVLSPNHRTLMAQLREFCEMHEICMDLRENFRYLADFPDGMKEDQLSFL